VGDHRVRLGARRQILVRHLGKARYVALDRAEARLDVSAARFAARPPPHRPDPYEFHRIAGTSAGAIVASFLAAGVTAVELKAIMTDLDFAEFEDESGLVKHLKLFGPPGRT
jgi:predicted acylesterase/phospholipase RssA